MTGIVFFSDFNMTEFYHEILLSGGRRVTRPRGLFGRKGGLLRQRPQERKLSTRNLGPKSMSGAEG